MNTLIVEQSALFQWYQLINEASKASFIYLTAFEAYELWSDTNSAHALKVLKQYTQHTQSSVIRQDDKGIHSWRW